MAHGYLISSLDVGTTKVCCLLAEIVPGAPPEIIGVGTSPCVGLKKGVVVDLSATASAILEAVRGAQRTSGEEIRSAVVGVSGEHVATLNSRSVVPVAQPGRGITESDIERVLEASKNIVLPPDREIIHAIPRWFSVDGQVGVRSPVGMHGNRLEVETHIVTGVSTFLRNVIECVHDAGLSVDGAVLEPIAAAESVLLPTEKDLGVVLVDIGGGTSDVAIYMDGNIHYSGVIPVAGSHVTRDIAIGLRTTMEEAERVKLAHGRAMAEEADGSENFEFTSLGGTSPRQLPTRALIEIIEPRMAEICHLVGKQIEKAGCTGRVPAGIVLTGGGSQFSGLQELVTRELGLAARVGAPCDVAGPEDSIRNPAYATAVGLIRFWHTRQDRSGEPSGNDTALIGVLKRIRDMLIRIRGA